MVGASIAGVIILGAGVAAGAFITGQRRKNSEWQRMDTLEEYLARYPFCDTPRGIQCAHCAAQHLQIGGDVSRKIFSCGHCGAKLYRQV